MPKKIKTQTENTQPSPAKLLAQLEGVCVCLRVRVCTHKAACDHVSDSRNNEKVKGYKRAFLEGGTWYMSFFLRPTNICIVTDLRLDNAEQSECLS